MGINMRFGYFDSDHTLNTTSFTITPRIDIDIQDVKLLADKDGWIFSPSKTRRIFGLPFNYQVEGDFNSEDHARFIIWCLSFIYGVRLANRPMEFLDATNIKLNHAFGFMFLKNADIEYTLQNCFNQFLENSDDNNRRICAIIHLLFMSRNKFYLNFENFIQSYMAIDCSYRIINSKYGLKAQCHSERMHKMAEWASIKIPDRFDDIPSVRNDLFHEGIYVDELLGYSHLKYNLLFVNNFICKILFKILNINDQQYISQSLCETRDMIGITLSHT